MADAESAAVVNNDYPPPERPARIPVPFKDVNPTPCVRAAARVVSERDGLARKEWVLSTVAATRSSAAADDAGGEERAYSLGRTMKEAIYGRVARGKALRRIRPARRVPKAEDPTELVTAEWETTGELVAVKEMSLDRIRAFRGKMIEDPLQEMAAMQHLRRWLDDVADAVDEPNTTGPYPRPPRNMTEAHVLMPLAVLVDRRYLYSVMPYCSGGEMFDVLDEKGRFTEPQARQCMRHVLKGLACLKETGASHRDMSLENLLLHDGDVLVIDMGMCVGIPYDGDDDGDLQAERKWRRNDRCLIFPQGTCGKQNYISPEVRMNKFPFDGHAVDLWAAGVALFIMLTGFPPWDQADSSDMRFCYVTGGSENIAAMLRSWGTEISKDAIDLFGRMFRIDPRGRLSLEQVWDHPWMRNGAV